MVFVASLRTGAQGGAVLLTSWARWASVVGLQRSDVTISSSFSMKFGSFVTRSTTDLRQEHRQARSELEKEPTHTKSNVDPFLSMFWTQHISQNTEKQYLGLFKPRTLIFWLCNYPTITTLTLQLWIYWNLTLWCWWDHLSKPADPLNSLSTHI